MDFMQALRDALALAAQAREAITAVRDAITGGQAGLDADSLDAALELLNNEEEQTRQANQSLQDAIAEARSNQG